MVDLDWKTKMVSSDIPKSPKPSNKLRLSIPVPSPSLHSNSDISPASDSSCSDYEQYLRLHELKNLWDTRDFPNWLNEPLLKPSLQALELTFRFISTVLSDPRPYANRREWKRRLESLATTQIQIIAAICEDAGNDTVPYMDLTFSEGVVLSREGSSAEVWKVAGETTVVSRTSEGSLLPRLATWHKSEDVAEKIMYSIECEFRRCCFTLGLGEPNLAGKPSLDYDAVCKPTELRMLKKNPYDGKIDNHENQVVYTTHQILETWIHVLQKLLERITQHMDDKKYEEASSDCYLLERIWKLLEDIEDLHLLMDPADFLKLKSQLFVNSESKALCFRSKGLVEVTRMSKDLRNKVPSVLNVEVDPKGGPRIQEAAMKLYTEREEFEKIYLLQSLQAIEAAMKRFFYAYKQVLVVVMGSLEASGKSLESCDSLSQVFLEPTYFPSLDAAKTFLGSHWSHEHRKN